MADQGWHTCELGRIGGYDAKLQSELDGLVGFRRAIGG
jgi:hypothetical protein